MAADVMQPYVELREPTSLPDLVDHGPIKQDLRIATIGNVDSGKSTLVGVLTRNMLDDGAGKARATVFHHKHEKETGRSSAVSCELMGFGHGKPLTCNGDLRATRQKRWQEIRAHSERSVTFVDLCGHEKYLKTTIYGMTAMIPDYAIVVVGANMGVARQTREHIGIAAALSLPLMIVMTKIDIAPPDVAKATMDQIHKTLKQARKMPFVVRSQANVATAASSILSDRITPVIPLSAVTGEGLDYLRDLLAILPPRVSQLAAKGEVFKMSGSTLGGSLGGPSSQHAEAGPTAGTAEQTESSTGTGGPHGSSPLRPGPAPSSSGTVDAAASNAATVATTGETCIDSVFNVPGVGTVVAGTVLKGNIHTGATMLLGPDRTGDWQPVTIRSIHVQYTPVEVATPGGSAAFAIRPKGKLRAGVDKRKGASGWVRKGMTLISPEACPASYWEFQAEILVLHHQTTMRVGYAPHVHTGVVSQGAKIERMQSLTATAPVPAATQAGSTGADTGTSANSNAGIGTGSIPAGADVPCMRTGDRALVTFRWMFKPEYVKVGDVLLFREGRAKGVGKIRSVSCPHHPAAGILAAAGADKE